MASQTMLAGMKFSITGTPNSHGTAIEKKVKCPMAGGKNKSPVGKEKKVSLKSVPDTPNND